jgi:6-phosphogluconolactonase
MQHFEHPEVVTAERAAAEFIAAQLTLARAERGRASLAISGGSSPWGLFAHLAERSVPWNDVRLFQVDERIVPLDHEARNWRRFLVNPLSRRIEHPNRYPMPVEIEDAESAAREYENTLRAHAEEPPTLDVVHLGLGEDGHTASLFAGDPLLDVRDRWVGVSGEYQGHARLSLTLPTLNRARCIVWFVVGASRAPALDRLLGADVSTPAGRVRQDRAVCFSCIPAPPQRGDG